MKILNLYAGIGGNRKLWEDVEVTAYQEIILLKYFFRGKYCVENVKSYYEPLIPCQYAGRHYFWANFHIGYIKIEPIGISGKTYKGIKHLEKLHNINISSYGIKTKLQERILRNCVSAYLGPERDGLYLCGVDPVSRDGF